MAFQWIALLLVQSLLTYLLTGAVTFGVVRQLRGEPAGIAQVISKGLSSFGRVFATGFLCGMRILLFSLMLFIPGIIQQVRLFVAIPVAVLENKYAAEAMARSRALTAGSGWPIFGTWLLLFNIGYGLRLLSMFLLPPLIHPRAWHEGLEIGIAVFLSPFTATAMAVAYFLLRQGKENVDAKAIAAVFD